MLDIGPFTVSETGDARNSGPSAPVRARRTEMPLEPAADDIIAGRAAHDLLERYGARAAGIARGRAKLADNASDAQVWLDLADAIERMA